MFDKTPSIDDAQVQAQLNGFSSSKEVIDAVFPIKTTVASTNTNKKPSNKNFLLMQHKRKDSVGSVMTSTTAATDSTDSDDIFPLPDNNNNADNSYETFADGKVADDINTPADNQEGRKDDYLSSSNSDGSSSNGSSSGAFQRHFLSFRKSLNSKYSKKGNKNVGDLLSKADEATEKFRTIQAKAEAKEIKEKEESNEESNVEDDECNNDDIDNRNDTKKDDDTSFEIIVSEATQTLTTKLLEEINEFLNSTRNATKQMIEYGSDITRSIDASTEEFIRDIVVLDKDEEEHHQNQREQQQDGGDDGLSCSTGNPPSISSTSPPSPPLFHPFVNETTDEIELFIMDHKSMLTKLMDHPSLKKAMDEIEKFVSDHQRKLLDSRLLKRTKDEFELFIEDHQRMIIDFFYHDDNNNNDDDDDDVDGNRQQQQQNGREKNKQQQHSPQIECHIKEERK